MQRNLCARREYFLYGQTDRPRLYLYRPHGRSTQEKNRMILPGKFFKSSVGRKSLMAVTGLVLITFVIAHLSGNFLVYGGRDALNNYAVLLRTFPKVLWTARIVLLCLAVIHIGTGLSLVLENRRARPVKYAKESTIQASIASRTMALTGLVILFYVIYHILHITLGVVHSDLYSHMDGQGRPDPYTTLIQSFQNPVIGGVYIASMFFLALHLSHAVPSLFQTLGWNSPRFDRFFKTVGAVFAVILFFGYSSIPVSIWLGLVR